YHLSGSGIDDLDNTTSSQVYCGMNRETPAQDAAVASTASQVVTYRGSVIDAVFSSSDGGHTECASATWGSGADGSACSPPYLQGVIANYDVSPLHTWYTPGYSL